jgi:hypothetical protein
MVDVGFEHGAPSTAQEHRTEVAKNADLLLLLDESLQIHDGVSD